MEQSCPKHAKKRGFCTLCGGCKGCDALTSNLECIFQHRTPRGMPDEERIRLKRMRREHNTAVPVPRSQPCREAKLPICYVEPANETEDCDLEDAAPDITKIISALGFSQKDLKKLYRKNPVNLAEYHESQIVRSRTRSLYSRLIKRLSALLLPEDSEELVSWFSEKNATKSSGEEAKLIKILVDLSVNADKAVRPYFKAVLAASGKRSFVQDVIAKHGHVRYIRKQNGRLDPFWLSVTNFSPKAFTRYKKLGNIILSGRPLPKQSRKCKVPIEKIVCLMEWVNMNLKFKPSTLRTVKLPSGDIFHGVPVYERSETEDKLFAHYKRDSGHLKVGRVIFKDCLRLFTKPSKQQTGVSDRYVDYLHLTETMKAALEKMMSFFTEEETDGLSMSSSKDRINALIKLLERQVIFMKYEYRTTLRTSSTNGYACCKHALGEKCEHEHVWSNGAAKDYFSFPEYLITILKDISKEYLSFSQKSYFDDFLVGMSSVGIAEWKRFPKHILRVFHQQKEINALIRNLRPGQAIVIMDYKQKINPEANLESQVEYYRKKGMSLLGFMV